MSLSDLSVSFPTPGVIVLESKELFADADHPNCKRFLERVFQAEEISNVTVRDGAEARAELRYDVQRFSLQTVSQKLAQSLRKQTSVPAAAKVETPVFAGTNGWHDTNESVEDNGVHLDGSSPNGSSHANGQAHKRPNPEPRRDLLLDRRFAAAPKAATARDHRGVVRYFRHDGFISGWEVVAERPGRMKLKNRVLHRKMELCQAIERELMSVLGIDKYKTNPLWSSVSVDYDPRRLSKQQVIEILDSALAAAEHPQKLDALDFHLPLCTASLPFAAIAQFAVPPLLPAAALLFAYTSIPTFKEARNVLFKEKRLGVDVLDAIVVVGCLGTFSIFPGAVLCWCLGFGRVLVKRTQDKSKRLLLNAFGKQPRYVWLYREGVEIEIPMEKLEKGDVIVVNTGDVVPVDGHVVEGMAMIDQHALTGESSPAEKGVGDRVFASTVMVAGKVFVSVETSGNQTASAKIAQILNDTAGYKLSSQHKGEVLADKAVIPTLTVGAIGLATMGPGGAVAVLNSDFGTGIRMAAPLAMLSSLAPARTKESSSRTVVRSSS